MGVDSSFFKDTGGIYEELESADALLLQMQTETAASTANAASALSSKTSAETSATNASTSATAAAASAASALASETAAALSETNAATSEDTATTQATTATTQATAAAASATAAASSETAAGSSATAAGTSATAAAASATAAATSETNAATSATAAAASAAEAGEAVDGVMLQSTYDTDADGVVDAAALPIDTDSTFAANSDAKIPSQKAVKAGIATAVAALVDSSPSTLDTLNELADALGDDPNFATTVTTALGNKVSTSDIDVTVQSYSAKTAAIAALTWAADKVAYFTSASAAAVTSLTSFGRSIISLADASAARTLFGLVIGTNVQAFDAQLSSVMPQHSIAVDTTLALTDSAKQIYMSGGSGKTLTIPANSSIEFPVGTVISGVNDSSNSWTLAITTDTLVWSPSKGTGSRTLADGAMFTLEKVTSTKWYLAGAGIT